MALADGRLHSELLRSFWLIFLVGILSSWTEAAQIVAVRGSGAVGHRTEGDNLIVVAETEVSLVLFGQGFTPMTTVRFTGDLKDQTASCDDSPATGRFDVDPGSITDNSAVISVYLEADRVGEVLQLCSREVDSNDTDSGTPWLYQSKESWATITVEKKKVKQTLLPVWLQAILIVVLLCLSGLFSGLNLGLMSLDKTELTIVENVGSPKERNYAKVIAPVRKRGNFLLCTILLGNVLVNNTLTILLDDLTGSGGAAIIGATIGIVIFGEIIPQAVCSRHGLMIGARTIWITKFFMVLTFPMSFPISKLLDCILGEEVGASYNRDRLRELLKLTQEHTDLVTDEVNIIAGALELSKKTVKDVMTPLEDTYMVEYNAVLDFETMNDIIKTGYTRIPVYEKEKTNIVALLNIKDLAFVDPDDRTPLKTLCRFYNHPVNNVFEDTRLDVMLEEFKKGRSHMNIVQRVNNEGEGDPFYETLGVVTLEDVIEEIIQSEIVDETDTVTDNRKKVPRAGPQHKDFSVFFKSDESSYPILSPQLALATYQYLATTVTPFKSEFISETVLQRLIKRPVVIQHQAKDLGHPDNFIYQRGRLCEYFILILQGEVEVMIGRENMVFNGGPFTYFGTQALAGVPETTSRAESMSSLSSLSSASNYVPDYSVQVISNSMYLRIHRNQYMAAIRATLMERQRGDKAGHNAEEVFSKEWTRATSAEPERQANEDPVKVDLNADKKEKRDASDKEDKNRSANNPDVVIKSPSDGVEGQTEGGDNEKNTNDKPTSVDQVIINGTENACDGSPATVKS